MSKKKTWEQVVTPPKVASKSGLVSDEADTLYVQPQEMETRNELVPDLPGQHEVTEQEGAEIQAAFEPKPSEEPESPEEKAARLDREDAETRASIPMVNGVPIPMHTGLTREQLENNPSDYRPPAEDVPVPVREEEDTFVPNPSVMLPEPKPEPTAADDRQQWLCLQDDGIRTRHPAFRSSAHLIDHMVACPACGNTHVRMVQEGEDVDDFKLLDWQDQRDRERERLALPRR